MLKINIYNRDNALQVNDNIKGTKDTNKIYMGLYSLF